MGVFPVYCDKTLRVVGILTFPNFKFQTQFSVFMTCDGRVFTCGMDRLIGQPHVRCCNRPTQVTTLTDKHVVDIAVGAEHTLCVTSAGDVFGWGSNTDGQLGLGHTLTVREPEKIAVLSGRGVQQVSAGRTHSAAWTATRVVRGVNLHSGVDLKLGTPDFVPPQYPRLQDIPISALRARLKTLFNFSDLLFGTWNFLPLIAPVDCSPHTNNDPQYFPTSPKLRRLLTPRVYTLPFVRTLHRTMIQSRTYGPQITVRRLTTKCKRKKPIFTQISRQVVEISPQELRLPARAWKVKLMGEGADDAGGVFDDTITEMCIELTNGSLPYLIPTPNSTNDVGFNRDRFLLNPDLTSSEDLLAFKFIGILFGVSIRTKKPVAIHLAPIVWKLLVGEEVTADDLEEVDAMYIKGLQSIRDHVASQFNEANFHEVIPLECYEGTSSTGKLVPIVPGGRSLPLTFYNRLDYIEKAVNFRLHELDLQVAAIREGMAGIVPVPLMSLMMGSHLEQLVCGLPNISIRLLKQVVRYREMDDNNELVQWLWSILEEFSNSERVLFMRFVSGRSRLPANLADFTQRFQVMRVDRPLNGLPTAQTCFFQLRLPPYSSKDIMRERLRYAINNCTCIDMDNYMLARNGGLELEDDEEELFFQGS